MSKRPLVEALRVTAEDFDFQPHSDRIKGQSAAVVMWWVAPGSGKDGRLA